MAPLIPQAEIIHDNFNDLTPVQQFYTKKSVFITGATGFLGKILLEKLLRSCDIENAFILIRSKKGKDLHSRLDDMFEDPIFERLKAEQPKFRHKVSAISGDCVLPELGICPEERITLQKSVNIVFHVAATTRFDEKLKLALGINVCSTKAILSLCREMENLKSVIHVSTAYANCYRQDIQEKFYKTKLSGDNSVKLYDALDDETLDKISPTLANGWPNTYTFTKCLAEDLVRTQCKGLPLGVFRPAIVIPTYLEPIKGWSDNMFGPTGIIIGCGAGLLRVVQVKKRNLANIVPVDLCVNSMIVSAMEVGTQCHEEPPIYNFCTSEKNYLTWEDFCQLSVKHGLKMPLSKTVWYYCLTMSSNPFLIFFLKLFYHTIPAMLMDVGLLVMGKKPKMMQIYRKIHRFCNVITYFTYKEWKFQDNNIKNSWNKLDARDKELFYFNMDTVDWSSFIENNMLGIRKYILKEDPSTIPQAIKRNNRMKLLHYTTVYTIYFILLYIVYLILSRLFFS